MKYKETLLVSLWLIFSFSSFSQNWPKVYPLYHSYPLAVEKSYDHGYVIGGWFTTPEGAAAGGMILKTDINGTMKWYKKVGVPNDGAGLDDVTQTLDGGMIITGHTEQYDSIGDPLIMKLNACGEKEWCRVFSYAHDIFDFGTSAFPIPGGYIAQITRGGNLFANDHIFLFRLDMNGNLVWQQQYALSDPLFLAAESEHMIISPDYHYLLSGWCYYPDSGTVSPQYLKPLLIKVDSSGTVAWEKSWHRVNGVNFHGEVFRSITDNNRNIYSCGRHIESSATPPGDRPTMLVSDPDGNELSYHDMVANSWQAVIFTINWFADSTIALGGGWTVTGTDEHEVVFKVDRSGNILDSIQLLQSVYSFADAIVDEDDKLFIVSPQHYDNQWHTYAWKLNHDLQLDTLYTHPFVYDSLCPHPIASDTIPLDCVIVGLDEPFNNPETGKLKVWPNPASGILNVEIPEKLKVKTKTGVYDLTTLYSRWQATLGLYDLYGNMIFSKEISQADRTLTIDVSAFSPGMYLVRIAFNDMTAASEKVIIR